MPTVQCSWEEFKQMAEEFKDNSETMSLPELDNAWKCLSLAYLGMYELQWERSAAILLQMECDRYINREAELLEAQE